MPAYDRHENEPLLVAVPTESPVTSIIDPASGIVGWGVGDDRVRIYFEGNRLSYANVKNFADRVAIAASRAVANYPTVASMTPRRDDLHVVGVFDRDNGRVIVSEGQEPILASWLGIGLDQLDAELQTTSVIK